MKERNSGFQQSMAACFANMHVGKISSLPPKHHPLIHLIASHPVSGM